MKEGMKFVMHIIKIQLHQFNAEGLIRQSAFLGERHNPRCLFWYRRPFGHGQVFPITV
jgi:hypothetical protein